MSDAIDDVERLEIQEGVADADGVASAERAGVSPTVGTTSIDGPVSTPEFEKATKSKFRHMTYSPASAPAR